MSELEALRAASPECFSPQDHLSPGAFEYLIENSGAFRGWVEMCIASESPESTAEVVEVVLMCRIVDQALGQLDRLRVEVSERLRPEKQARQEWRRVEHDALAWLERYSGWEREQVSAHIPLIRLRNCGRRALTSSTDASIWSVVAPDQEAEHVRRRADWLKWRDTLFPDDAPEWLLDHPLSRGDAWESLLFGGGH